MKRCDIRFATLIVTVMVSSLVLNGAQGQVIVAFDELPAFKEMDVALREPLQRALAAIPEDTESFLFVRGPLHASNPLNERVIFDPARPEESLSRMPFDDLRQVALKNRHFLEAAAFDKRNALEAIPILFVAFAARRMAMPTQIPAAGAHQFIEVAQFAGEIPAVDQSYQRVTKAFTAFGVDVWKQVRQGQPLLYLARPTATELVCSNSEEYLRGFLARRRYLKQVRVVAFPASLLEWGSLDARSAVWGLRHFRTATRDTSATNLQRVDASLAGITFQCDSAKVLRVRLIPSSTAAPANSREAWAVLKEQCGFSHLRIATEEGLAAELGIAESWKQGGSVTPPSELHFGLMALLGVHVAL